MSLGKIIYLIKKYNLIYFIFLSLIFKFNNYFGKYGVISAGGVATTNLIKFLSKFVKLNDMDNLDGLKHLKYLPNNKKILYFYSLNLDEIIQSLRRRHFFYHNSAHLGSTLSILFFFNHKISNYFFKKKVRSQILLHLNSKNSLCIKYENIWKDKEKIMKFLKIKNKKKFKKKFPKKRKREIGNYKFKL
tara:strand:+ start:48 stop:614 length:567 start_codon:yes stop_codon:yes gene_type:complete